jgi:TRAP transporter TAXI family solute receptor
MSKLVGLIFAAFLLAVGASTSAPAADPNSPKSLTVATASVGGVYYVYGDALAKILTEKLGMPVNPLPTQGTVHNVKLLDSGEAQVGMVTMGVALEAWNGTGDWTKGEHFRDMRALFPMYDTPLQAFALPRSGITALTQLNNKRVAVGPRAGTGGTYIPAILKLLGIQAEISYESFDAMTAELLNGRLDVFTTLTGAPMPAIQQAEAKEPLTFVSPSAEQIETICKAMPEFSRSTIAAGTYHSLDKDYVTIGVYNFAIGRADLPDDLVYQLVKAVFENQPRLMEATLTARDTVPKNVDKDTFLPFHPGAIRYYREIGLEIPHALAPTD